MTNTDVFRESGLTSIVGYFNRSAEGQEQGRIRPVVETNAGIPIGSAFFEDKRRIEASAAWRRTQGICQLKAGTHFSVQNRLTHTVYTQNIGERICRALQLGQESADLVKAIIAAHDIGHAPFNHGGEYVIANKLKDYGREWNHDAVGLRVVHEWESRSTQYSGLNLTLAVTESLAKRFWKFADSPQSRPEQNYFEKSYDELPDSILQLNAKHNLHLGEFNTAEGQIATLSDWISFTCTDIEDGLNLGGFTIEEICRSFDSVRRAFTAIQDQLNGQPFDKLGQSRRIAITRSFVETLENMILKDLIVQSTKNIERAGSSGSLKYADDVRGLDSLVISVSPEMRGDLAGLQRFHRSVADRKLAEQKIPYREFVDEMMEAYFQGEVEMSGEWAERYRKIDDPGARMELIAEYMVREVTDTDVSNFIVQHRAVKYASAIKSMEHGSNSRPALH